MRVRPLARLGGAALLLGALAFWEHPLLDLRLAHPELLARLLLLYAPAPLAGLAFLAVGGDWFILRPVFPGAAALLGLPWALVWGLLWARMVSDGPAPLGWQGLALAEFLGLAPLLAGLVRAFTEKGRAGAWSLRALGWLFFFTSGMNLWLQPSLGALAFPAAGGMLIIAATFASPPKERQDGL